MPAAILGKLPPAEFARYEAHRWRWLGMQADKVPACLLNLSVEPR